MKKALIVANLAGFVSFLQNDIDTLQHMGYQVIFAANGESLPWEDSRIAIAQKQVAFVQIDFDSKNPFSSKNYTAYRQIAAVLQENQFDLIHCHTPIAGLITRLAAAKYRRKGTKVLYTTHGFSFSTHSSLKSRLIFKTLETAVSGYCDGIITINQEDFAAAKKMACPNVYYIHGVGVDINCYAQTTIDTTAYRSSIGVGERDSMVLSVGELSDRKNHQVIIRAIGSLPSKSEIVYVICGNGIDGGTADALQTLAREQNVRLILLGFRQDIPEITKCADISALPSRREGLGLAGIQSLAAGVPVIGTNVQGIRDYVIPGETGYLVDDPEDFESFAVALNRYLLLSKMEQQKMAKKCQQVARDFDVAVSVKEMKEIYAAVLGGADVEVEKDTRRHK